MTTAELIQMRVREVTEARHKAMLALDDMRRALASLDRSLQFLRDARHPEAVREVPIEVGGPRV